MKQTARRYRRTARNIRNCPLSKTCRYLALLGTYRISYRYYNTLAEQSTITDDEKILNED